MSAPCPLHGVDDHIRGDNFVRPFLVAIDQRADGLFDLSLDQTAHFRERAEERLQVRVEGRRRVPGVKQLHERSFVWRTHARSQKSVIDHGPCPSMPIAYQSESEARSRHQSRDHSYPRVRGDQKREWHRHCERELMHAGTTTQKVGITLLPRAHSDRSRRSRSRAQCGSDRARAFD